MRVNLPDRVRLWLYIITGVFTPIIAVLTSPDVSILPSWVALIWAGEVTFIGTMAALNVSTPSDK